MPAFNHFYAGVVLALTLITPSIAKNDGKQICKCVPGDACWPTTEEWSTFNQTIGGRLIAEHPPAAVCYPGPKYDQALCNHTLASWFDSNFHAANPISIDYPVWANHSCDPIFPNGTSLTGDPNAGSRGCTIGSYPVYAVNASGAEDISSTVKWAASKNIRLVVKNSGHSFNGRSTGYGSLSIWTHNMRGFQFHNDWKPKDCQSQNGTQKQMAATLAAGMQDREVYAQAHNYNAVVVGGSNPSVGIMGWFPGGGHGPLSSSYGMGADNLLEAVVVTMKGETLTVNECSHSDLYWALRGGGSGTFGILVEATMKAFPTPQTSIVSLNVGQVEGDVANISSRFWEVAAKIHAQLPKIKDGGGQGYYQIIAPPQIPIFAMTFFTYHYDSSNDTIDGLWKPVTEILDQHPTMLNYTFEKFSAPSFFDIWNASTGQAFESVATGGGLMGSRLMTRRSLTEDVNAVAHAFEKAGPFIAGHLIANDRNRGLDTALNPGWRDAVTHLVLVNGYQDGDPPDVILRAREDLQKNKTYALKQLSPESGAYFNEADPYEPDWQYTFFGVNYPRLRKIKEKYDPNGVLWCTSCVGSEDWVEMADQRLCRPSWF